MDALSDVLRMARLTGGVFLHADFSSPWCIESQIAPDLCSPFIGKTGHIIIYHYVAEGTLSVKVGDEAPLVLKKGEIVILPRNDLHLMGSDITLPPTPAGDVIRAPDDFGLMSIKLGGGGEQTRLVCGFLGCEQLDGNPIINILPRTLRLNIEDGGAAEWIRTTFQYAADEIADGRAGSETVLAKLSELLFVEAVRRYVDDLPPEQTGWLSGLKDPYVSRALALLHSRINHPWTVDELGSEMGMSRSALAERFTNIIGEPPMQYLTNWRMQVAQNTLGTTHASLAQIADQVGYDSEAAFSRAFKRSFGVPPATWRRQKAQGPD